jgi:hypothetical protein
VAVVADIRSQVGLRKVNPVLPVAPVVALGVANQPPVETLVVQEPLDRGTPVVTVTRQTLTAPVVVAVALVKSERTRVQPRVTAVTVYSQTLPAQMFTTLEVEAVEAPPR